MNIRDIEPTKGHVLIEVPKQTTEINGIVLAGDQANNAPVRGTVVRTSKDGSPFKVGEEIFFRKYAIDELKFQDEALVELEVYVVDEAEVLGAVRPFQEKKNRNEEEERATSKEGDEELREAVINSDKNRK